jgi:hypothetical protein
MRLLTFSKLLVVGLAVRYAYKRATRRPKPVTPFVDLDVGDPGPDPGDPVQGFDEAADLHVADLSVDALDADNAEAERDEAIFESDLDQNALELDTPSQTTLDAREAAEHDTGELYGVHTGRAVDNAMPDDSYEDGQNWIEALETSAIEYGAEPEEEVAPLDEVDKPPHPSDLRDRPVADRGSGGPSGV